MSNILSRPTPLLSRLVQLSRPRRLTAALTAALCLAGCGGGGDGTTAQREQAAALKPATSGQVVEQVRTLVRQRHAARQARPGTLLDRGVTPVAEVFGSAAALPPADAAAAAAATTVFSNTLVQEAGVDEADLFKTDGRVLYAQLRGERTAVQLKVARPGADGSVTPLQTLSLPSPADTSPTPRGLLLADTAPRLLALGEHFVPVALPQPCPPGMACATTGMVFAPTDLNAHLQAQVAERAADGTLSLGARLEITGQLVASRRVGNVVYLVTTHTPRLAADTLPTTATAGEVEAAVAAISAADVLPRLSINGGSSQPLVNESDCLMQPGSTSRSITVTTVVALDLGSAQPTRAAVCFLGGTEALYMSPSNLYLATTRSPEAVVQADGRVVFPSTFVTDIHKFAFTGMSLQYRASGEVPGHLGWDAQRMALRMGEYEGDLRVLSFTGSSGWLTLDDAASNGGPPASPATLTVLRESTDDPATRQLLTVATLPNASRPAALGKPGEQIHGVRFAGTRAYLVTFRQIDPLYVLDLSVPGDPRTAGVLEVPGFSDTLLPLGDKLLLGVGRDATANGQAQGVKLALFDVADISRPTLKQAFTYGAQGSVTALDFSNHGLNLRWVGDVARLALPMVLTNQQVEAPRQWGLHRWEVNTATGTMTEKPRMATPAEEPLFDLSGERSLQVGDAVFYLTQGLLVGTPW